MPQARRARQAMARGNDCLSAADKPGQEDAWQDGCECTGSMRRSGAVVAAFIMRELNHEAGSGGKN
jgi:hypothetical protein